MRHVKCPAQSASAGYTSYTVHHTSVHHITGCLYNLRVRQEGAHQIANGYTGYIQQCSRLLKKGKVPQATCIAGNEAPQQASA